MSGRPLLGRRPNRSGLIWPILDFHWANLGLAIFYELYKLAAIMSERKVKCPYCRKIVLYSTQNEFRPFCSERCQLMDLGQWASETYAIPVQDANSEDDVNKKQNNEDEEPEPPPRHHLN